MRICHLHRRSVRLQERQQTSYHFQNGNNTSRPQRMASAASTVGSSAWSLLCFICTKTASLSRHAPQSAPPGTNPHCTKKSLLLGTFFFWGRLQLLSKSTGWRPHKKNKVFFLQTTRQTRGHQRRNTNRERQHAHQFCGFSVLHRLGAASVCSEKEEASRVWNITPPPPPAAPTSTQYFHHRWITNYLPLTWKERALPFAKWHLMSQIPTTHHLMESNFFFSGREGDACHGEFKSKTRRGGRDW